ncbi:MAG: hypothetical protein R2707_08270 [Acidimicrobiales bacterium]
MTLPPPPPRPVAPRRPVHRGIWVGIGIVVLGVLSAGAWLFASLPSVSDDIDRFHRASPQVSTEFTIVETVDWDVFIEPSVTSQSGVRYEIVDAGGRRVPLGRDHGFTYNWFGRSGRSIASVELEPGTYRLRVVDGTASIAVGASPGGKIFRAIGGAVLVGLLLGVPGVVIAVVSAVRDTRRRNRHAEPPPPSPWSAGEWPASGR